MTGPQKTKEIVNAAVPFLNVAVLIIVAVLGYFLKSELDGLKLMRADIQCLWRETANIRAEMATMPKESPPPWFVARFDKMEASFDAKLGTLQIEVNRLSNEVAKLKPSGPP